MVKYFCDICEHEVDSSNSLDDVVFTIVDGSMIRHCRYYACNDCRERLKRYISRIKEESKNGTT